MSDIIYLLQVCTCLKKAKKISYIPILSVILSCLSLQSVVAANSINDTTLRFSALREVGATPFRKNALVTIDKKKYPTSILYEISNASIGKMSENSVTGAVDIVTKTGKIIYLTAHEKDNLYKENTLSGAQLYTRIPLTKENGQRYDHVSIGDRSHIWGANRIAPNDKVGFMVNGVLYDEEGFKKLSPAIISKISGIGTPLSNPDPLYHNKYKVLYFLTSTDYQLSADVINAPDRSVLLGYGPYNNNYQGIIGLINGLTTVGKAKVNGPKGAVAVNKNAVTDILAFKTQAYKVGFSSTLVEIINKLPNLTINGEEIFIGRKKVTSPLFINSVPFTGRSVLQGVKVLIASAFTEIQIINANPNNAAPATINVISRLK
jgi:hypothetical protein